MGSWFVCVCVCRSDIQKAVKNQALVSVAQCDKSEISFVIKLRHDLFTSIAVVGEFQIYITSVDYTKASAHFMCFFFTIRS